MYEVTEGGEGDWWRWGRGGGEEHRALLEEKKSRGEESRERKDVSVSKKREDMGTRDDQAAHEIKIRALVQRQVGEVMEGVEKGGESRMGRVDASRMEAFLDEFLTFGVLESREA